MDGGYFWNSFAFLIKETEVAIAAFLLPLALKMNMRTRARAAIL